MVTADQFDTKPVVPLRDYFLVHIAEENCRLVHMAEDQIGIAVIIDVADRQPTAEMVFPEIRPSVRSSVEKCPISPVSQQHRLLAAGRSHRVSHNMSIADHQ